MLASRPIQNSRTRGDPYLKIRHNPRSVKLEGRYTYGYLPSKKYRGFCQVEKLVGRKNPIRIDLLRSEN